MRQALPTCNALGMCIFFTIYITTSVGHLVIKPFGGLIMKMFRLCGDLAYFICIYFFVISTRVESYFFMPHWINNFPAWGKFLQRCLRASLSSVAWGESLKRFLRRVEFALARILKWRLNIYMLDKAIVILQWWFNIHMPYKVPRILHWRFDNHMSDKATKIL